MAHAQPCRTMTIALIAMVALAATCGCHTVTQKTARQSANQRWDDVRARFKLQLAEQRYEAGSFEEAIRNATESIALLPDRVEAYVLLARANLELGRSASAGKALDAARRAGLESTELIYTEGVILEQSGELAGAEAKFRRAFQVEPTHVDHVVALAECLVAMDRAHEAIALVDSVARASDDDASIYALAAHIAMRLGKRDEAARRFRMALNEAEPNPIVAESLGRLLVESGRFAEGVDLLTPLLHTPTDDPLDVPRDDASDRGALRRSLATAHLALGHPHRALGVLLPYAENHPDDAGAQLLLAKSALAVRDNLTALRALQRAEQRLGSDPELWLVRATIAWRRGDFVAAATDLHDVLTNRPEDVEAMCLLGEVLRSQGDVIAARRYFDQAQALDPNNAWARQGLRSLRRVEVPARSAAPARLTSAAIDANGHPTASMAPSADPHR